jgi:hypothetical protein
MAQPFDITLKHLLESHPADCLRLVGFPTAAPIDVIDADGLSQVIRWLHAGTPKVDLTPTDDGTFIERAGEYCGFAKTYADIADMHKCVAESRSQLASMNTSVVCGFYPYQTSLRRRH